MIEGKKMEGKNINERENYKRKKKNGKDIRKMIEEKRDKEK